MDIQKYNAIARETGRAFNIFEIARIEEKEVIVCRVLTELLNPKGRHGQGGAYLKLFMRDCLFMGDAIDEINIEDMRVMSERFTDNGRPIDVVIEGSSKFIPKRTHKKHKKKRVRLIISIIHQTCALLQGTILPLLIADMYRYYTIFYRSANLSLK
ncbi:MAG: PD-(D/E)XK nuclease family protein [Defluviitaleaceae bacterium]|nr:PD-(D/E)XK nuclease family protein [Defluviitaleaceae bacterium]